GFRAAVCAADGKFDRKRRSSSRRRTNADAPAMLLRDRVRDGKAETGSFANFLRREEGVEDSRLRVVWNARTIIGDFENGGIALVVMTGSNGQHPASIGGEHRLFGVDQQVEEHLLDLMRVRKDFRNAGSEVGRDR